MKKVMVLVVMKGGAECGGGGVCGVDNCGA